MLSLTWFTSHEAIINTIKLTINNIPKALQPLKGLACLLVRVSVKFSYTYFPLEAEQWVLKPLSQGPLDRETTYLCAVIL